jgi:tRNA-specific 2-thiouridylase
VRSRAAALGLRTAAKPDSQDVCFIPRRGGRQSFLSQRVDLHPGRILDEEGRQIGQVPAVELVTVGQRKGLGGAIGDRYVTAVDGLTGTVHVGALDRLLTTEVRITTVTWAAGAPAPDELLAVQMSAHGQPVPGRWRPPGTVMVDEPVRRVAPGQSVVLYRGDEVVGGGVAARP